MKRRKRRIIAILLAFAMVFTMVDPSIFGGAITVQAEETSLPTPGFVSGTTPPEDPSIPDYYNVVTAADLRLISDECGKDNERYLNAHYLLWGEIVLTKDDHNEINIGTSKNHFKGTFDGQGHSITGLSGDAQTAVNNGLFGVMEGATVKNLVIKNADYRSNQYGGILAAQAENSVIQNVTIIDSSCKVASLGAVVGLITTGGLYGGALVGYAGNTKIYNCESRNTKVYVDTTGGVQALGGDGMYMGGLVGWIDDGGILEYSRVVGGTVSTEYYVAVGALAANNLYAGGLVGRIDGSDETTTQVLDCFSSASVNYDGECYVSVGAGLSGYAGGIAARISGSNYKMERCHYAGNIHGSLLNSILVLPVIAMKDYYLGGVAGNVQDSSKIRNCYFNWNNAIIDNKYPGGPKVPAICGESNRGDVTTIGDAQYSNSTFFVGFDFDGTDEMNLRDTNNNELLGGPHYNKWVINRATNMPVHGNIVYAETDFPGAGTISFAATSIQEEKKTDGWTKEEKPDDELANGISISQIAQTYSDMNEEVILTATVNEGYNFEGWYLRRDGVETAIQTEQYNPQENYKLVLGGDSASKYDYKDGDVFVAKYKADVVFENLDGSAFATEQCTYKQTVNTSSKVPSAAGYIFLGWSVEELPESLNSENLSSTTIDQIATWAEDNITVTKAMHLYPVFIQVTKYNVGVQMQSASQKEGEADYIKEATGKEGTAKICTDENGDIYITVEHVDKDGKPIEGINEEKGYRFSGWYEVSEDETSGKLVSRNKEYYLTNVDLTQQHQYEARYQYRVRAYIPIRGTVSDTLRYVRSILSASYFGDFYVDYNISINDSGVIPTPGFKADEMKLVYWTNDVADNWKEEKNFSWGSKLLPDALKDSMENKANDYGYEEGQPEIPVTAPMEVYGIVRWVGSVSDSYRPVNAQADFPSSITDIKISNASENNVEATIGLKDGYKLNGFREYVSEDNGETWSIEDTADAEKLESISLGTPWMAGVGYSTKKNIVLLAQISAKINMYYLDGDTVKKEELERKYNSPLFNPIDSNDTIIPTEDWDADNEYQNFNPITPFYSIENNVPVGNGNTKTDKEMYRPNYQFVGWITLTDESATDLFGTTDLEEIAAKKFVTENRASVDGYLLYQPGKENTFKVTEAIDICPVYVPYNATFKTNFADSTVNGVPMLSEEECIPTNDGVVTITLPTVDGYTFQKWEIISEDGVNPGLENDGEGNYTFTIKPETEYTITAVYEATVSFKDAMKDSNGTVSDKEENYLYNQPISDKMDELPISYAPVNAGTDEINMQNDKFNENTYVFVGWKECSYGSSETEVKDPTLPYEFVSESDPVLGATNMIPVYMKPQVGLDSNIGEESKATISVSEEGIVTLKAPAQDGYVFTGWVENINGKEEIVSTTPNYVPSPKELRDEHTYIACYDVIVTYKIPEVKDGNIVEGKYTDITDAISYGQTLNSNYNMQAIIAAQNAFNQTTSKAFTGKWSTQESGDPVYEGTEAITKPLELFPISTEAVIITYKIPKVNENGQVAIDENGKSNNGYEDFTTNIPVGFALKDGYDEAAKLQMETRMSGNQYMFTGKWTDNIDTQDVYDRTAAITQNITLYPILKKAVTITYKIPSVNEDTGKVEINEDGTSDNYDDFQVRIPAGETISDTYDKEASIKVAEVLENTDWVFTGDWTTTEGDNTVYEGTIDTNTDLYPILAKGAYITVYSNMDDNTSVSYNVGMVEDGENLVFPEETVLLTTTDMSAKGATGIDGRVISAQFVGYSLVTIDSSTGNRTSDELYKAGDKISKTTLDAYKDDTRRIYAVWTQIQNMAEASIYKDASSRKGLFTAAAVNTKILANAGLQNNTGCGYERYILYSKGSKYSIVKTNRTSWNNTLYKNYFDKDFVSDGNWNMYVSFLYNIKESTDEYGVCPYLGFSYADGKTGNFRDQYAPTNLYTLKNVAERLTSLDKAVQESYSWFAYKSEIEDYTK